MSDISATANDPRQYDNGDVIWAAEGSRVNQNRRLYLKYLQPYIVGAANKDVLDIGSGHGWLCAELAAHGARPVGIEPSAKNVKEAQAVYSNIAFELVSLQDYKTEKRFDQLMAVMVWEHFLNLTEALRKVASLLKANGQLVTIIGDYEKFTKHQGYPTEVEQLGPNEAAIRTDYGNRIGVLCDITRTVERYLDCAQEAGLELVAHTPITPPSWHPRHQTYAGKALFHLLVLGRAK
jgi:SAM-dependent methyltransferase